MTYAREKWVRAAFIIPAKTGGRPYPNPPPEGEGIWHTPSLRLSRESGNDGMSKNDDGEGDM